MSIFIPHLCGLGVVVTPTLYMTNDMCDNYIMASNVSRGNYYKRRTKDYLEKLGYTVQLTEFLTTRPIGGGKVIYVKKDVFGSDGIAMNGNEIIFWNAKSTITGDRANVKWSGKKDFSQFPFPTCVKRHLYIWEPRKPPIIVECT